MREPVNVFYYPDMSSSDITLKKAILFFDEIHFMDRGSFFFGGGEGQVGTIGATSPLRAYEQSFREHGIPLYVHDARSGPLRQDAMDQIASDINDPAFLSRYQEGLRTSKVFRNLQIARGNYGESGTHEDLARQLIEVELPVGLKDHPDAMALLMDGKVEPFKTRTPAQCARVLIQNAAFCSAKMNFALEVSSINGFAPFADATPYGALLASKYQRAVTEAHKEQPTIQLTDLSFAIFDEFVPLQVLEDLTFGDVVGYRKESAGAREAFLEHLGAIQAKQGSLKPDEDYQAAISKIVQTEIVPAARTFKNKMEGIRDTLFGNLAKGFVGALGTTSVGSVGLSLFGALSWPHLLALTGPAAAYATKAAIDTVVAKRGAARECAISYVLNLD
jgi:hypothetical protein